MSIIVKEGTVNKQTYKINNLTKITKRNILQMILKNLRKELLTNDLTKKRKETSLYDNKNFTLVRNCTAQKLLIIWAPCTMTITHSKKEFTLKERHIIQWQ